MVKFAVLVIVFSVICGAFGLDTNFSPVLYFKNKGNSNTFAKGIISSTTPMKQREFEQDFNEFAANQKIVILVTDDLSPEDLSIKNVHNERGFQNLATNVDIVKYLPYVENAVDNKVTMGVKQYSLTTTNELEPEPSGDARIIIVTLPECDDDIETRYHCMAHIDRACFALSQSEKYKDALFILTSEMNSHLAEVHSRKARDTNAQAPPSDGKVFKSPNSLVYFKSLQEREKKGTSTEAPVSGVTTSKIDDKEIAVTFEGKYRIVLTFNLNGENYVILNKSKSTIDGKGIVVNTDVFMPQEFSYACVSSLSFNFKEPVGEIVGVYFKNLQFQLNFTNSGENLGKFGDAYDCIGFTSPAIWAGLFITFLLLSIVGMGITYIMDIKTMDKFDDAKGKTITINAAE